MVTWTIFINHLFEVGLTYNRETIVFQIFGIVGLFYFCHVWGPTWIEIHWNNIWSRAQSRMTSHYTWGSMTILLHDFGGVLGRPLDTFFLGFPQFHGSRLLACVWSDPNLVSHQYEPLQLYYDLWPPHTRARCCDHVIVRAPWLSSKGRTDYLTNLVCRNLCQAYLQEVGMMQIAKDHETLSMVCHARIHCKLFMHNNFLWALRTSPSSGKWTWAILTFSTNNRS